MRSWLCFLLLVLLATPSRAQDPARSEFEGVVRPFLTEHCVRCHGESQQKGGLRVDSLTRAFESPRVAGSWTEIMDRINSGEMPPIKPKEPRPKGDEVRPRDRAGSRAGSERGRGASGRRLRSGRRSRSAGSRARSIATPSATSWASPSTPEDPSGLPEDPGLARVRADWGSVLTLSDQRTSRNTWLGGGDGAGRGPGLGARSRSVETTRWSAADS